MKKIYITQPLMPKVEEYVDEIKDLFQSKYITNNGIKNQKLEKELTDYLKVKYLSLMTNGHMSLYCALKVLNLKGEVITTPFTFISTTHAIVENGLTPVFCDIKDDFTIDEERIEELITDKTCAILAVHTFGNPCNVKKIDEIAKKHNLKVIYDAAHCFGVEINNKSILSYGDISILSFHATKVFNTIEGGAIITNNKKIKDEIDSIRNFGISNEYDVEYIGTNAKMDEFRAAMGLCNLKCIDREIKGRKIIAQKYLELLKDNKNIVLPNYQNNIKYNYGYFPILLENRDKLYDRLKNNGIITKKCFYPIVSETTIYKNKYISNCKNALNISKRVLLLPIYSELSNHNIENVCKTILK